MINKPGHVTDEAAELLSAADEARIRYILSKPWVHYPKAKQIVDLAHSLLNSSPHDADAVDRRLR